MKKYLVMGIFLLMLTGCGREAVMETIADVPIAPAAAQPRQVQVDLPDDVVAPVLAEEGEQIYLCNGYEIVIETLASGDLSGTIQSICGYEPEDLTVMTTQTEGTSRYEFVWASAGERGDRLGRAVVVDDGNYHYCMSILRDAAMTEDTQIVWRNVFESFQLV